jgi:hypothetical protein
MLLGTAATPVAAAGATAVVIINVQNGAWARQPISVNVTVEPQSTPGPSPSGQVTVSLDGQQIGTQNEPGGQALWFSLPGVDAGTHQVLASYGGDANYSSSSATASQYVNQYASRVSLSGTLRSAPCPPYVDGSSCNFVTQGDPVRVTASVQPQPNGTSPPTGLRPTGSVLFYVDNVLVRTVPLGSDLTAATAVSTDTLSTVTPTSGAPGSHIVSAWYSGDVDFQRSGPTNYAFVVEPKRSGYWMLTTSGDIFAFGDAVGHGGPAGHLSPGSIATHIEPTPDGNGYWVVSSRGDVYAYGDAPNLGGLSGLAGAETVTSLSATPSGRGYWLFTNLGRVRGYGDAGFFGDLGAVTLNGPILDSVATPSGNGYYMVGSDGGIFTFGDARFSGSMGGHLLNSPVVGLSPAPGAAGYWLVASDGGIFAFNAPFHGSLGGTHLNRPVIGMVAYGDGYLMVASDGGIFDFSNRPFAGSLGANPPPSPVVGVAPLNA